MSDILPTNEITAHPEELKPSEGATRYRAMTPDKGKDGTTYWKEVGVGFSFSSEKGEGISAKLFALPVSGEIVFFKAKPKQSNE